jgi:HSP20 family protein
MYRYFRTSSFWREMDRLQRDMNRLFNQYAVPGRQIAPSYPAVNVWSNEEGLVVSAEMPGVKADNLDINVQRDTLTISGVLGADELPEGALYHRKERGSGNFSRTIQMPFTVEPDAVEASFKDGVLTIKLPRAEADKPKKIAIKS